MEEQRENTPEINSDRSEQKTADQGGGAGKILASWNIPEYNQPERKKIWYFYVGVIVVALLVYSYFSKNPLFALIIVLGGILYFMHERRGPRQLVFALAEDGLIIGEKLIEYTDLENFYLIYFPPKIKNLYFTYKNALRPVITVSLHDQNPAEIRKILLKYLPEDLSKEEIPASESIGEIFKL